ncbi:hypothetical protein HZH68_006170 [Vespula germanica]|uniref:Uncharacterized protein n=2 Tax=Vespula TaxID=7451 RepID=A0A834KCU1_VESGE|nr:hypothetical protein HZH68_006170 [Vespula germanica]
MVRCAKRVQEESAFTSTSILYSLSSNANLLELFYPRKVAELGSSISSKEHTYALTALRVNAVTIGEPASASLTAACYRDWLL